MWVGCNSEILVHRLVVATVLSDDEEPPVKRTRDVNARPDHMHSMSACVLQAERLEIPRLGEANFFCRDFNLTFVMVMEIVSIVWRLEEGQNISVPACALRHIPC